MTAFFIWTVLIFLAALLGAHVSCGLGLVLGAAGGMACDGGGREFHAMSRARRNRIRRQLWIIRQFYTLRA